MPKSSLDSFIQSIKDVKKLITIAVSGLICSQVIALLAGIQPPWPKGILILTSMIELLVLMMAWHFSSVSEKMNTGKILVILFSLLCFFSLAYVFMYSLFVYNIPGTSTDIVLGCGLTHDSQLVLSLNKIDLKTITDTCPEEFTRILSSAEFEATRVWTPWTVKLNQVVIFALWLAAFSCLAAFMGIFVAYHKRRQSP